MSKQTRILEVVDYNYLWPDEFRKEAKTISQVLQHELVQVHHIGSTAVPGLKAKPVIDILLEVKNVDTLDEYDSKMVEIGYVPKGEFGISGRRFYLKEPYDRTHHIHAFNAGSADVQRHIAFRDYLIAHPIIAKEYESLKIRCADECDNNNDKYCDGKHAFLLKHEKLAIEWMKCQSSIDGSLIHPPHTKLISDR